MYIFETKEDMAIKLSIFDIKVFGFLYLNLKKSYILQKKFFFLCKLILGTGRRK